MSEHYYTNQPTTPHDFEEFTYTLKGKDLKFVTDSGVFSRNTIDYGSKVLIETFNPKDLPEGTLLDLGCGYGPIGLSMASFTKKVEMVDINERSVSLAQGNANRNGIHNVVVHKSNLYQNVLEKQYAGILSNPPIRAGKKVVHEILEKAYDYLMPEGLLTVVLQKKQGAPSAEKKMQEVFGNVEILTRDKGYYILQSKKN